MIISALKSPDEGPTRLRARLHASGHKTAEKKNFQRGSNPFQLAKNVDDLSIDVK
jgi:hypothetical protein